MGYFACEYRHRQIDDRYYLILSEPRGFRQLSRLRELIQEFWNFEYGEIQRVSLVTS